MFQRRFMKRTPSLCKRLFSKKIKLSSDIRSQLDSIFEKSAKNILLSNRILIVGNSSERKLSIGYLDSKLTYPIYRVDLGAIVNKYIGETEKNLNKLLTKAENMDWILLFDEADALFGKRTDISDAHDRYANMDVSWLLERIADFEGIVILASNEKGRISDEVIEQLGIKITIQTEEEEDQE